MKKNEVNKYLSELRNKRINKQNNENLHIGLGLCICTILMAYIAYTIRPEEYDYQHSQNALFATCLVNFMVFVISPKIYLQTFYNSLKKLLRHQGFNRSDAGELFSVFSLIIALLAFFFVLDLKYWKGYIFKIGTVVAVTILGIVKTVIANWWNNRKKI